MNKGQVPVIIQTEWNSNEASLRRIDEQIQEINYYSDMARTNFGNVLALKCWENKVLILWKEVFPKATMKEKSYVKKLLGKRQQIPKIVSVRNYPRYSIEVDKRNFVKRMQLVERLEMAIRHIADNHGMLLSDKPSRDDEPRYW